jgi:hypothetical protein
MARENSDWGYDRIAGALKKLGHDVRAWCIIPTAAFSTQQAITPACSISTGFKSAGRSQHTTSSYFRVFIKLSAQFITREAPGERSSLMIQRESLLTL